MNLSSFKSLDEIAVGAEHLVLRRETAFHDDPQKHIPTDGFSLLKAAAIYVIYTESPRIPKTALGTFSSVPLDDALPSAHSPRPMFCSFFFRKLFLPLQGPATGGWVDALLARGMARIKCPLDLLNTTGFAPSERHGIHIVTRPWHYRARMRGR